MEIDLIIGEGYDYDAIPPVYPEDVNVDVIIHVVKVVNRV